MFVGVNQQPSVIRTLMLYSLTCLIQAGNPAMTVNAVHVTSGVVAPPPQAYPNQVQHSGQFGGQFSTQNNYSAPGAYSNPNMQA